MEQKLIIQGGKPLQGKIEIRGSKNAASKMMVASLLTDQKCVLENIPLSAEVGITRELCEHIGSFVLFDDNHTATLETPAIKTSIVRELSRRNRIPILAFGPLLHRLGSAEVPLPGGDAIGHRPINFHLEALNKMGVRIERREHSYYAEADHIYGADVTFAYPSVGATENIMLTAVLADGTTMIRNAAVEPEICNIIEMLTLMGARIQKNEDTREIVIEGVAKLNGANVRVMPDRNEIVSFVTAALATGGDIFTLGAEEMYLKSFLARILDIGASFTVHPDGIAFSSKTPYRPTLIETAPHPGFMTDWQQPFCVLLTQADGESIIHETVYEDRFGYTKDLKRMGADIELSDECLGPLPCRFKGKTFNHSIRIKGVTKLWGNQITMTDIRAGMAHIVAALTAQGESVISGIDHIDRGYEKLDERLRMLGANIKRV